MHLPEASLGQVVILVLCLLLSLQLKMETKIIEMVWNIVVPVTAHKELQESRALTDVIKTYADLAQVMRDSAYHLSGSGAMFSYTCQLLTSLAVSQPKSLGLRRAQSEAHTMLRDHEDPYAVCCSALSSIQLQYLRAVTPSVFVES